MEKIKMTTPLVEMDGDEMTRILWAMIKEQLILPFVDLKTEYYDLGLLHRNETEDRVGDDALLQYMKRAFDGPCRGSLELLTGTVLPDMARKLRAKAARPLTGEARHD